MGRTKGALNKPKPKNSATVKAISLNKYIENTPLINDETPYEWVTYGKGNNFPDILLDYYYNSITNKSCIDFIVSAIMGQGIDWEAMKMKGTESYPNFNDSWDTFIEKIILDYEIFGAFSFQVIKNNDGKTFTYYHQAVNTVRLGKKDDDGNIKFAYLCKDWNNYAKYRPIPIDILNFTEDEKIAQGKPYLFYYSNHNIIDEYYGMPQYCSAFDAIKAEIEMKKFDLASIQNLFTPSGALTLNRVDDEEERNTIMKQIEDTFTGSENANKIIVSFRNSNDDKPVEFTPFTSPTGEVDLFKGNDERTVNRIVSAHRIPNKALIGFPMDQSGFSNEGSLLEASYNLIEKTFIGKERKKIFGYINKMLAMNGIDTELVVIPLKFNLSGVLGNSNNDVDADDVKEINDEDVEEKLV